MPSFLDELRSKQNAAIQKEQEGKKVEDKLMMRKEEIIDKIIQCDVNYEMKTIKNALTSEIEQNPKASYVSYEHHGDLSGSKMNFYDFRKCFLECGIDVFDIQRHDEFAKYDTHNQYMVNRLNQFLKEIGANGNIAYDSEDREYHLYGNAIPALYNYFSPLSFTGRATLNAYGKKYMEKLVNAASKEGIHISYNTSYPYNRNVSNIRKIDEKNRERNVTYTASVSL